MPQKLPVGARIHPPNGELRRFAQGRLTDPLRIADIESHLSTCQRCQFRAADTTADGFMQRLAETTVAATEGDRERRWSAGFEIVELIGRGGSGLVYRARQPELGREVALKFLRSTDAPSPMELARFRREATVLARLRHPHIIDVYDAGEQQGRPFIAMEFVAGETLADRLGRGPLEARRAAEWLACLADAVEFAHGLGVIHRDLKPQNILLAGSIGTVRSGFPSCAESAVSAENSDADRCPKIADFGLSRLIGDTSAHTRTGAPLGTPSYMAPEQLVGDLVTVGPVTDVYGLGAVLYECLTSRPPFRGATALETMHLVRSQDIVPVDQLRPEIPRDLRTICERCLEKNPARRFPSAGALREDLRAFLDGRPIASRPQRWGYRVSRWLHRNPRHAVAACLVLVGLVLGGLLLVGHQRQLNHQRQIAEQHYARARTAVWDILNQAHESSALEIPKLSRLILDQSREAVQFFDALALSDHSPQSQTDLARMRMRLGTLYLQKGDIQKGKTLLAQAFAAAESTYHADPANDSLQQDVVESQTKLGVALSASNQLEEAVEHLRNAVRGAEAYAREFPDDPKALSSAAWVRLCLGNAYYQMGRHRDAERHYARSVAIRRDAARRDLADVRLRTALADSIANLGQAQGVQGNVAQCLQALREATDLYDQALREQPHDVSIRTAQATVFLNLSNYEAHSGDLKGAVGSCTSGINLLQPVCEADPDDAGARQTLSMLHANRGLYLCQQDGHADSLADWEQSVALCRHHNDEMADYCSTLWVRALAISGNPREAQRLAKQLERRSLSELNQYRVAAAWGVIAGTFDRSISTRADDRTEAARECIQRSARLLEALGPDFFKNPEVVAYVQSATELAQVREYLGEPKLRKLLQLAEQ